MSTVNRLSAAIAKARARDSAAPRPPPGGVSRLPLPAVETAWAGLRAHVPNARHLARNRIVAGQGGDAAMPFDILRTRLLREMRTQGWRRVAITSPDAGCGKSTLAANLALSLARQSELRCLLVEMDLRRPTLARLFGIDPAPQFSEALRSPAADRAPARVDAPPAAPVLERLVRIGDNLALAVSARPEPAAGELLQSRGLVGVLETLERELAPGVTVFDLPPMLRSDDTLGFLDKVDCALLVVEAEVTPVQQIDMCEQELARGTAVLGVVVNKLRHVEAPYGYG